MTDTFIRPGALRPPARWLREKVFNFSGPNVPEGFKPITPEGFRRTIYTMVPDATAVQRDADALRGTSSASKLLAGQLVAHHVLYKLVLPDCVLRALASALGLQARHYDTRIRRAAIGRAYAEGKTTAEIAEAMGLDARSVRRLRGREAPESFAVADAHDPKALWDIVADLTERGVVLPGEMFHAVIVALGRTDGRGRLRPRMAEDVLPKPQATWEVTGMDLVEPEDADDDGVRIVAELRKAEPRIGLRTAILIAKAIKVEAWGRFERGHWAEPALTYQRIADEVGVAFNTVRTWAAKDAWDRAVSSHAYWLGEPIRVALEHEALAIVRNQTHPGDKALAALVNDTLAARSTRTWATVTPGIIATWRTRLDWQERVDAKVQILAEVAEASRKHGEAILARQAKRTRGRESG